MTTPTPIVRFLRLALGAIPLLALVACVPYQTYEQLKIDRDKIKSAHDDLVVKYNRLIQDNLLLQKDGAMAVAMRKTNQNLVALNDELQAKLKSLDKTTPETVKALVGAGIEIENGEFQIPDAVLFSSGEAKLKNPNSMGALDAVMAELQKNYPDKLIHITGHTDTDPVKVTKSIWKDNQRLSYERAYTVFQYFTQHGIPESRIMCHAAAYLQPREGADPNTKEGKAKNRRVAVGVGNMKI